MARNRPRPYLSAAANVGQEAVDGVLGPDFDLSSESLVVLVKHFGRFLKQSECFPRRPSVQSLVEVAESRRHQLLPHRGLQRRQLDCGRRRPTGCRLLWFRRRIVNAFLCCHVWLSGLAFPPDVRFLRLCLRLLFLLGWPLINRPSFTGPCRLVAVFLILLLLLLLLPLRLFLGYTLVLCSCRFCSDTICLRLWFALNHQFVQICNVGWRDVVNFLSIAVVSLALPAFRCIHAGRRSF